MDMHDGITPVLDFTGLDLTNLRTDNYPVQSFNGLSTIDGTLGTGMRTMLPHTTRGLEFDGLETTGRPALSSDDRAWLDSQDHLPLAFACRNLSVTEEHSDFDDPEDLLWKKATYAVQASKLQETHEFARAVLGLESLPSQFPEVSNGADGCLATRWNRFTGRNKYFEFHLVSSAPSYLAMGVDKFHDYLGMTHNLESDCFDHYLYDSLILWADSLDPYVRRLQQLGAPFLALKLQDQLFSIVFSFPMAPAITIDIRSSSLDAVEAKQFDSCKRTHCPK